MKCWLLDCLITDFSVRNFSCLVFRLDHNIGSRHFHTEVTATGTSFQKFTERLRSSLILLLLFTVKNYFCLGGGGFLRGNLQILFQFLNVGCLLWFFCEGLTGPNFFPEKDGVSAMRAKISFYKMQGLRHVAGTHQQVYRVHFYLMHFPHLLFLLASKPLPAREVRRSSSVQTCSPACRSENEATIG